MVTEALKGLRQNAACHPAKGERSKMTSIRVGGGRKSDEGFNRMCETVLLMTLGDPYNIDITYNVKFIRKSAYFIVPAKGRR